MKTLKCCATLWLVASIAACGRSSPPSGASAEAADTRDAAAPPAPRVVELPAGTIVAVRLDRAISTVRDRAGDRFDAILEDPVSIDGMEVLPRGTAFTGHVTTSTASGRLEGRAVLGITLDGFEVNGRHVPVSTSLEKRTTAAHKKRNIEIIGGATGLGALIGGLAGGGKGAGIGAAVGAGAGTGAAATTGKKEIEIPAETIFHFSLNSPVTI
jgi:hypothetical protein